MKKWSSISSRDRQKNKKEPCFSTKITYSRTKTKILNKKYNCAINKSKSYPKNSKSCQISCKNTNKLTLASKTTLLSICQISPTKIIPKPKNHPLKTTKLSKTNNANNAPISKKSLRKKESFIKKIEPTSNSKSRT